jgi:hypothetical protein
MPKPAGLSLRGFVDFSHIDTSLKSLWHPFNDLVSEMNAFIPRPIKDYEAEYSRLVDYYQELNPNESKESIANRVQIEIDMESSEIGQFDQLFTNRFMTQYAIVAMISHTLCEASINAILAFGLGMKHTQDQELAQELFSILEKIDIKEKWCTAPKVFSPNYKLDKGIALFDTFNYLTKQRNALTHHKINLHVGGKLMFEGSNPKNKQGMLDSFLSALGQCDSFREKFPNYYSIGFGNEEK